MGRIVAAHDTNCLLDQARGIATAHPRLLIQVEPQLIGLSAINGAKLTEIAVWTSRCQLPQATSLSFGTEVLHGKT